LLGGPARYHFQTNSRSAEVMAQVPDDGATFDYIIVGGGSAGCVLANRLSERSSRKILLIESGPAARHPLIAMPKGLASILKKPRYAWHFNVPGQEGGIVPREVWAKGRTLGGSSSVNAMVYTCGHPDDYAAWAAIGGSAWGWPAMQAAFGRVRAACERLRERPLTGAGSNGRSAPATPLGEAFIRAGEEAGLPRRDDVVFAYDGVAYHSYAIGYGRRISAARAYLEPARARPNLTIVTACEVERVVFAGRRAVGVAVRQNGARRIYNCSAEIILAAGAIMSPKILQLSGIGDRDHLLDVGVDLLVHSPKVGVDLQDHLGVALQYRLLKHGGLNRDLSGARLVLAAARYALSRSGPLSTGLYEVGGFFRTSLHKSRPDGQLSIGSFCFARDARGRVAPQLGLASEPGVSIYGQFLQPTSKGTVRIVRPDPSAAPDIQPNWLATGEDMEGTAGVMRFIDAVMRQPALAGVVGSIIGEEPPSDDGKLPAYLRGIVSCGQHTVGTCRLGADEAAVLDPQLRVRGIDGLRVADCSAMPGLVSSNTNAAAMAFAELAAEHILLERP
ncbi:MAG TPA: GMC family oxidoreductase N-terminal domain-containing protein, partial [Devosia sp.]|nr:GMC family oxidoreductase N-terminal domain-containing protein [Devosia sp.]